MRKLLYLVFVFFVSLSLSGNVLANSLTDSLQWLSLDSNRNPGSSDSGQPVVSSDGRYIAFSSYSRLVIDDIDEYSDIYLRDRLTGNLELVSISENHVKANGNSFYPTISGDGRYVAFYSSANNLADGAVNGVSQVYVRDIVTGKTKLVSVSNTKIPGNRISSDPAISKDGRYIAFTSEATNLTNIYPLGSQIYVYDQLKDNLELVSVSTNSTNGQSGYGNSKSPSISGDGRYVAYTSYANNLVAKDTNMAWDAFVMDRATGTTMRVSVASSGEQSQQPIGYGNFGVMYPAISEDGKYVVFYSLASNLVNINTNGKWNVYVHNLMTGETSLVSVSNQGITANDLSVPGVMLRNYISVNGRWVVFQSSSPNLADGDKYFLGGLYIRDIINGTTERLNLVNYYNKQVNTGGATISSDGRYLVFQTADNNLFLADHNWHTDVFLLDRGIQDNNAPDTLIDLAGIEGRNNWYISNVIVSFTANDEEGGSSIAKTEYSFDGQTWHLYTTPIAITKEGQSVIYYRSLDNGGNVETTKEQVIYIDKTPPTIEVNLPDEVIMDGIGLLVLNNSVVDNLSGIENLYTYLDGKLLGNEIEINLQNISFGTHNLLIKVVDNAGNESQKEMSFQLTANRSALAKLVDEYYREGLIKNQGIYKSLKAQLAQDDFAALINHLEAQQGKQIDAKAASTLLEYANWVDRN